MEYMGDAAWWNARFNDRELELMQHEMQLEKDKVFLRGKQKVLDLACGDGRNSIYLARKGCEVVGMDFSREALQRLSYFAVKENLQVRIKLADLRTKSFDLEEKFDLILINHYKVKSSMYSYITQFLNKDGLLWVNGFCRVPSDNPNVRQVDLIQEEDFQELSGFCLLDKEEYEADGRKFVRYIWKKER